MTHSTASDQPIIASAFFTDEEIALIAHHSTNPDIAQNSELYEQASEALNRYYARRTAAIRLIQNSDPATLGDPTDPRMMNEFTEFYALQIHQAMSSGRFTLSEQCEQLHRLITGIDMTLSGDRVETMTDDGTVLSFNESVLIHTMPSYSGEMTVEAREELVNALAYRLSTLNTTQHDLNDLTENICTNSASLLTAILTEQSRRTILREAMSIYALAHEGKLSDVSQDVTIEECVEMTALSSDLDAIEKAEARGELVSSIVSVIVWLLLVGALIYCFFGLSGVVAALADKAAVGFLHWLYTALSITLIAVPAIDAMIATANDFDEDLIVTPLTKKAGKLGRYLGIMLPAKIRAWFNRRSPAVPPTASAIEQTSEDINDAADVDAPAFA